MQCPICDAPTPPAPAFLIHRYDEGDIPVMVCGVCDHSFALEIPSASNAIRELYDSYYHEEKVSPPSPRQSARALRRLIERSYGAEARVIDIGCNTGSNLLEFGDTRWELHGVEPAAPAARMAREHTRATIHEGLLEDLDLPQAHFDYIIFNQVIEHIREPIAALQSIVRLLAPGGTLMLGTVDRHSRVARQMGKAWPMYYSTGHYHFFCDQSVTRMVEACGLAITRRRWGGAPMPRSWVPHRSEVDELVKYRFLPVKVARVLNSQAWAFMSMLWTRIPICDHIFVWARHST